MNRQSTPHTLLAAVILFCAGCSAMTTANHSTPYITVAAPIRIVSANDGDANQPPDSTRQDSITVIDLSADAPPKTRTVAGAVPNTFNGAPVSAIIAGGRYAVISNHAWGQSGASGRSSSQITVVDLDPANSRPLRPSRSRHTPGKWPHTPMARALLRSAASACI